MSSLGKRRSGLISLLLLAFVLRVVACVAWSDDLHRDPDAYRGLAECWRDGKGYVAPDGRQTAYRPPVYPLALSVVLPAGSPGIAALQIFLGIGTVAMTVATANRIGLGRFSLLAGALVAVDPLLLRYTPQIMTEVTCALFAALLLWLGSVWQQRREQDLTQPSSVRRLIAGSAALGVAFGIATLSRPTFWAFGMLAALVWCLAQIQQRRRVFRSLAAAACVVAAAAIAVLPWTVRNASAVGSPVLTTTHGGYTLLLANNPVYWNEVVFAPRPAVWTKDSLETWQRSLEQRMAKAGIAPADEVARDEWMKRQAVTQIRSHPILFVRSVLFRLARFWSVVPAGHVPGTARIGVAAFYLVVETLLLVGLWRWGAKSRHGQREALLLTPAVLLVASFTLVHCIYWTDARMRAPCVPAISLLTAFACSSNAGGRPKTA